LIFPGSIDLYINLILLTFPVSESFAKYQGEVMIQKLRMQYDAATDGNRHDAALMAGLCQEYEWINGTHRPEEPAQWLVVRADLAKRCPHMAVPV
jgi:hypothetical protein